MVVTNVQDYIAAGQFRRGEQLIEAQQVARPGTILILMEPIFKGGLEGVTPGSSCVANAYTSNHDVFEAKETGAPQALCTVRRRRHWRRARDAAAHSGANACRSRH